MFFLKIICCHFDVSGFHYCIFHFLMVLMVYFIEYFVAILKVFIGLFWLYSSCHYFN